MLPAFVSRNRVVLRAWECYWHSRERLEAMFSGTESRLEEKKRKKNVNLKFIVNTLVPDWWRWLEANAVNAVHTWTWRVVRNRFHFSGSDWRGVFSYSDCSRDGRNDFFSFSLQFFHHDFVVATCDTLLETSVNMHWTWSPLFSVLEPFWHCLRTFLALFRETKLLLGLNTTRFHGNSVW